MIFQENIVRERTINDAWRSIMWCCIRKGYVYTVEKGSYEGQKRWQLPEAMIIIEEPWIRPLAVNVPEHLGFSAPTSEEKINLYFDEYIVSDKKEETEDYTYGMYIHQQWERAVDLLNVSSGKTNQATITIGDASSIFLTDPPCLRVVSFKVLPGNVPKLQMSVFFRSWDLFAGFPENLGGLQLLKELILMNLNFEIEDGPLVAYSDGLHIYEQYFALVNQLNVDKLPIEMQDE